MSLQALRNFSQNLGLGRLKPTPEELAASVPGGTARSAVRDDPEVLTDKEKELLDAGEALPTTPSTTQPKETEEEDGPGFWSEIFWGIPRGLRDAAQGVLSLGDSAAEGLGGNLMPDKWHEGDWYLGKPTTTAGSLSSGIIQFTTGFVPAFKLASMAGKASKVSKAKKLRGKVHKGKKSLEEARDEIQALRIKKPSNIKKGIAAGAVADFSVFKPDQARLADLLSEHVGLDDSVTNFLKYEGNEDDPEYLGRLKNVIEGLIIEGAVGGTIGVAVISLKKLRKGDVPAEGLTDAEAKLINGLENPWTTSSKSTSERKFADGVHGDGVPSSGGTKEGDYRAKARELEIPLVEKDGSAKTPGKIKLEVDRALKDKAIKQLADENVKEFEEAVISSVPKGRGGDISLESSTIKNLIDGTTDTSSLWNVIRTVTRNIQSNHSVITKFDKKKQEDIFNFVNENQEAYGNLDNVIKNSSDKELIESANEELIKSVVIYKFMRQAAEDTVRLARKHVDDPSNRKDFLDFIDMFAKYGELSRINSLRGSIASGALMQRKFLKQGVGGIDNTPIRPLKATLADDEYIKAFAEKLGTADSVKLAKRLDMIANFDEFQELMSLGKISEVTQQTLGRKLMNVSKEVYINSLLQNPATQVVNTGGSLITNILSTMERTLGSLMRGNLDLAKSTLRHQYSWSTLGRAFRALGTSFAKDSSVLVPGKTQFIEQKNYKRAIAMDSKNTVGTAVNFMGALVNLPSRALVSVDEFFKQLAYTGYVKGELAVKYLDEYKAAVSTADTKALKSLGVNFDPERLGSGEFGKWLNGKVERDFNKHVTSDGAFYSEKNRYIAAQKHLTKTGKLFGEGREEALDKYLRENPPDEAASNLANSAQKMANELTFTNDVSPWLRQFENVMRTAPMGLGFASTLLIPFFRTPINILTFAIDRSPIGGVLHLTKRLKKKYRDQLKKGTETDRSQAWGKITTGVTVGYMWQQLIDNTGDTITGGGPQNKQERDALRATGWQPYSFKVGDTYHSYQRLDPIATLIGVAADWRDYVQYDKDPDEGIGANIALIFAENLTDKTFLQGVNNAVNLIEDPEYYGPKLLRDIAGGFVPNAINHFKNTDTEIIVKETRTLADAIFKRLPGFEDKVAPKRTVLGDVVYRENPWGTTALNPIYKSTDKKDVVANAMAKTQHGFSMPGKKFYGIPEIDLTEIPVDGKHDAYDRYMELSGTLKLGGKTLKQRIKSLVQSKGYQRLPDETEYDETGLTGPRVKRINKIINTYRSRARYELLKELPQLKELFDGAMAARREIRSSVTQ